MKDSLGRRKEEGLCLVWKVLEAPPLYSSLICQAESIHISVNIRRQILYLSKTQI